METIEGMDVWVFETSERKEKKERERVNWPRVPR